MNKLYFALMLRYCASTKNLVFKKMLFYFVALFFAVGAQGQTDVAVTKAANNPTPTIGSSITFTITANNLGPTAATGVIVTDNVPAGYAVTSVLPSAGTWTAPNWNIGSLANNASATLTIVATVNATGPYANTATITANEPDPTPANNTSTVTPVPQRDTDGDGVVDTVDLDDDNDGILDTVECAGGFIDFSSINSGSVATRLDPGDPSAVFSNYVGGTSLNRTVTLSAPVGYGGAADFFIGSQAGNIIRLEDSNSTVVNTGFTANFAFSTPSIPTITANNTAGASNINQSDRISFTAPVGTTWQVLSSSNALITVTGNIVTIQGDSSSGTFGSPPYAEFSVRTSNPVLGLDLEYRNLAAVTGTALNSSRFSLEMCSDFDGDGLDNQFDLDADNDGCSDANEYYNNATADGNDNGVYGTGVPTVNPDGTVQGAAYTGSYTNVLVVGSGSAITSQPGNSTVVNGATTTFSVVNTAGSGVTNYQWQENAGSGFINITNGGIYSGANTATLTLTSVPLSLSGNQYRVIISQSNFICSVATSSNATLQVQLDTDGDGNADITDLDDDNDGILDTVECGITCNDPFLNGGFESPDITGSTLINQSTAGLNWQTTSTDGLIELWQSGFLSVPAAEGAQFAELNATQNSALYQTFCLNGAGGTVNWSVRHRGRSGVDVAAVKFGSTIASALASTAVEIMSDGNTAWGAYSGTYTIPAGTTSLVIAFEAVSSFGGNVTFGNFIDDVQVVINQSCGDTDGDGAINRVT